MVGSDRPIGIFDSGVGGLTVVRAVRELMPQENLIYFGDTARSPYGPRELEEIRRFAFEIMDFMVSCDVKMMVMACNTMASASYEEAKERYDVPIIGVIDPGVRAGAMATRNGKVGVLGTQATIASGQYQRAFAASGEDVEVHTQVCPVFVERVEAGDTFSEELISVAESYLQPLMQADVDTLVLGCTHYPLLRGVLHWVTKGEVLLISSAEEVAKDVYSALVEADLVRKTKELGSMRFIVSGDPDHFRRVGSRFLGGLDEVKGRGWPSK